MAAILNFGKTQKFCFLLDDVWQSSFVSNFDLQDIQVLSKQFSGPILLAIHMPDDFYLFLGGFGIIFRTSFRIHFSDLIRWTLHMAMCPISSLLLGCHSVFRHTKIGHILWCSLKTCSTADFVVKVSKSQSKTINTLNSVSHLGNTLCSVINSGQL